MRFVVILSLGGLLAACSTTTPSGEETAVVTNPVIEQRIEERLAQSREKPAPSVQDIPDEGPALPTPEEMQAERDAILAERAGLVTSVSADRTAEEEDELAARAAALKARIAHDRALVAAEGRLSEKPLPQPLGKQGDRDEQE